MKRDKNEQNGALSLALMTGVEGVVKREKSRFKSPVL